MNKCRDCSFYKEGRCALPLWKDGAYYPEHETHPEAGCGLFEQKTEESL